MNREEIMNLADHQGLVDYFDLDGDSVGQLMLCTLVLDCIAAEREACAKVLDEMAAQDKRTNYYAVAANAIRARGHS